MHTRDRLEGANIVPMAMALVHLTGDLEVLREIAPHVRGAWDHLESVPPELAASIRDRMASALDKYSSGYPAEMATPDVTLVQHMMSVSVGEQVDPRYMPMLIEHMGLEIRGLPSGKHDPQKATSKTPNHWTALIVGAGASGICAAIALDKAGISYKIIEKGEDVGGTWNENRYPGCAVDTPNHFYQYSFEPNNAWSNYFSRRQSIHEYLRKCATKYNVYANTIFSHEVESATFDEKNSEWAVSIRGKDGVVQNHRATFFICAVGQLSRPHIPDFPGTSDFQGEIVHTGVWPEDFSVSGKKVALIGTGASAVQVGPAIADSVEHLYILQRSGSWISRRPNIDREVTEDKKWALENIPFYAAWYRFQLFWAFGDGLFDALVIDSNWKGGNESINKTNAQLREKMLAYMRKELGDREDIYNKVIPSFPPFGKRVLGDPGWFKMLKLDNVSLETSGVDHLSADGIVLTDGAKIKVDAIICATGFKATQMLSPMKITGRGGMPLEEKWGENDARAYLGVTVPDFPNMFILFGPNTNLGHGGSAIFLAECQVNLTMALINHLASEGGDSIECRHEPYLTYNEVIDAKLQKLSWSHPSVSTWYKNANGRIVTNQPWKLIEYWELTRNFNPEDYVAASNTDGMGHKVTG